MARTQSAGRSVTTNARASCTLSRPASIPTRRSRSRVTQLDGALFALVRGDEGGQLDSTGDQCQTALRVGFDRRRGAQRHGHRRASRTHRLQRRRARFRFERFSAVRFVGMQMQRASAGGDGGTSLLRDRIRGPWCCRVLAVTVERRLQVRRSTHENNRTFRESFTQVVGRSGGGIGSSAGTGKLNPGREIAWQSGVVCGVEARTEGSHLVTRVSMARSGWLGGPTGRSLRLRRGSMRLHPCLGPLSGRQWDFGRPVTRLTSRIG